MSFIFQPEKLISSRPGKAEEADGAISVKAGLKEVLTVFRAGAQAVAVYDDPICSKGFRGMIEWEGLANYLSETVQVGAARLQSILESSFDAVCMIDNSETVILWNDQAENLYGIKKEEILGKNINSYFTNLVVTRVLKEGVPILGAYHQPCRGTDVIINVHPVLFNDKCIGSVSVERDITNMVVLNRELIKAQNRAGILESQIKTINTTMDPFKEINGHSQAFRAVIRLARKVAATDAAVLLYGESGSGKEVIASALHAGGLRRDMPFIPLNCGAIPFNLFESELFGYEGGAFTGAEKKGKPGIFALAHSGTLFLDEISELHPGLQVKLLRVLQNQLYYPVGGSKPQQVDVRIIAATNQDLEKLVQKGKFREDLYYRLNVVTLKIPPLRERKNDIPALAYQFLAEFSEHYRKQIAEIDSSAMNFFLRYHWPGNIRELRNVVERMVVLTEGSSLTLDTLHPELRQFITTISNSQSENRLGRLTGELERELILNALRECQGNKSKAAASLGLPRSSLYYHMSKLGISGKNNHSAKNGQ